MIGITGAGGFIGSHLVEALLVRGEEIIATDLPNAPSTNLLEFVNNTHFRYSSCDVRNASDLQSAFPSEIDSIFHMAATVGVDSYMNDPLGTVDNIVTGTRNVLEQCLKSGVKLISMSTSEIYGKNPEVPWTEASDRVLGDPSIDRWSYSTSKALSEHLINAVHKRNRLPTIIIRPFNVYGPRQRPSFIIPAAIQRILSGQPPIVYDYGTQTRCFTYVDDLIEGLLLCLDSEAAIGQTFNLGSQLEISINEVVKTVVEVCASTLTPVYIDTAEKFGDRYEDIGRRVPDASKAYRLLGWKAKTPLVEGIRQTVDWMKSHQVS